MDFLGNILKEKSKEVNLLKDSFTFEMKYKKKISFLESIKSSKDIAIIGEIKRGSPSKGLINEGLSPVKQALSYESYGASAISVLTDSKFFYGSYEFLRDVRTAVDIPLLCKDFIIDKIQIQKAYSCGADMYLLIAAALSDDSLKELYDYGRSIGMEALVEVHNEAELDRVLDMGAELIGINNRDLKTFEVDIDTTLRLIGKIGEDKIVISESGIYGNNEFKKLKETAVRGILVGEALVRAENLEAKFQEFRS